MDLKLNCGLVLFLLCISMWTVEVSSWPERVAYRNLRDGLENGVNEGNDVQDGDEGQGTHYHHSHNDHHHHHHHRSSSSHLRMKPNRNMTHPRSEDGIRERSKSTNPDRGVLRRDSEHTGSTRQESIRRGLKWSGTSGSVGGRGARNKLRGHRGAKSWRRHGTTGRIPSMRTRQDDDYEYDDDSGGEGRHAYLMTTNERPADKLNEDDVINWAFDKHMRPSQHKGHQETETVGTETDGLEAGSPKEDAPEGEGSLFNPEKEEDSGDELKHDVYAYQLPSDLWFIVRYARDEDGHIEKYMNIVDSFTNYLDKLEEGVRTVSVNVKGVETVFRLTPKHKPFHRPPSSS